MVRYGILGSGFVADFYCDGLRDVPIARAVANYSRSDERARAFATRRGIERTYTDMAELCADPEVDIVIIALPNHLHLEATRVATAAGKGIVCTKPLARNAQEAAEMVRLVKDAGVLAGYAETEVFSPNVMKAREMIESGAIGEILSVRAREAHSGPHAEHFWDAELAGGGALLDMGCHTIEAARYFFGKDVARHRGVRLGRDDDPRRQDDRRGQRGRDDQVRQRRHLDHRGLVVGQGRDGAAQRDRRLRGPPDHRLHRDLRVGLHRQAGRLPDGEGRRRDRLRLPDPRRGAPLRLLRGAAPLRRVLPDGPGAARDVRRRLHRQRDPRRLLPLDEERALGAGRARSRGHG